jgi:hypothetical protein
MSQLLTADRPGAFPTSNHLPKDSASGLLTLNERVQHRVCRFPQVSTRDSELFSLATGTPVDAVKHNT